MCAWRQDVCLETGQGAVSICNSEGRLTSSVEDMCDFSLCAVCRVQEECRVTFVCEDICIVIS